MLPGHGHILRRGNRKARLSSWGKLAPEGDLPVARAVRRCCKRPLGSLDPPADEDDVLRFEIEPAHVPRELVPSGVIEEYILREVPARVEDLPVGVVLEDEYGASLFRKFEAQARQGARVPDACLPGSGRKTRYWSDADRGIRRLTGTHRR